MVYWIQRVNIRHSNRKEAPKPVHGTPMRDAKNVAFRSAISGYNREDVNKYILSLNREWEEKTAETENALQEAQKDKSNAESAVSALNDSLMAIKSEKEALERINESLKEAVDQKNEEIAALTERLLAAEQAAAALREQLTLSGEDDKSVKYDRISAQIGDIMISANTSANAIVAAANEHATRIMTETETEANSIRARLSDAADEMLSQISGELHTSTENCISEMTTSLREMRDNASALIQDFEKRSRDLSVKVEYYQTSLNEAVNALLSEMDKKYGTRPVK